MISIKKQINVQVIYQVLNKVGLGFTEQVDAHVTDWVWRQVRHLALHAVKRELGEIKGKTIK